MQIGNHIKDTLVFLKPVIWMETEIIIQLVDVCCIESIVLSRCHADAKHVGGRVNAN